MGITNGRYLSLLVFYCVCVASCATQRPPTAEAEAIEIKLPENLQTKRMEFSSMSWIGDRLLIVPQYPDRFSDAAFALKRTDITASIKSGKGIAKADTLRFVNLGFIKEFIGKTYEGFESATRVGEQLFFTIETNATNASCYLITGKLSGSTITLDTRKLLALPKVKRLSNAGYESLAWLPGKKKLIAFFEYNKSDVGPWALLIDTSLTQQPAKLAMDPLMFRLTDVAAVGANKLIATNFHFSLGKKEFPEYIGTDSLMVVPELGGKTLRQSSFSRIIELNVGTDKITWKSKGTISFRNENWEGIAPFKKGALIITDEYPESLLKWVRF